MGITVKIINEKGEPLGEPVGDPKRFLHEILPSHDDPAFAYVNVIDWYADTIFNQLQMPRFLREWRSIMEKAFRPEDLAFLKNIEKMAMRVEKEDLIYLKFVGD